MTENEARWIEIFEALGPVLQNYRDVLILARGLAERAAAGGDHWAAGEGLRSPHGLRRLRPRVSFGGIQ